MELSNAKEIKLEDNGSLIRNSVLIKKDWGNIIAGTLSILRKAIVNIQSTEVNSEGNIIATFMGDYVKIEYSSRLDREKISDATSVNITTVNDKNNGKLLSGCRVKVTRDNKILGEIYIDLITEQISGDIILKLGDIEDDILLEHTLLKGKNTELSSVVLSSIGVKYNGNPNNQIRDTVHDYNEAVTNNLNKFLSITTRNYADYFIANDPLNVMLEEMANGSDENDDVLE